VLSNGFDRAEPGPGVYFARLRLPSLGAALAARSTGALPASLAARVLPSTSAAATGAGSSAAGVSSRGALGTGAPPDEAPPKFFHARKARASCTVRDD
jgi:hypothetical protein